MATSKKTSKKKVSKKKAVTKKAAAKKVSKKKVSKKKAVPAAKAKSRKKAATKKVAAKKASKKRVAKKATAKKKDSNAEIEKKITGPTVLGKLQMLKLNPKNIVVKTGFNPRIEMGDLTELKASIKKDGVQVPISVRKVAKHYELVGGERRLRCVLALGLDSIPAVEVRGKKTEEEALVLALINNDGKPLAPVEEADAFRRLIKEGWTAKKIAQASGKRLGLVKNRLELISAHPDVAKAVKGGKLSLSMGTAIAKKVRGKKVTQKALVKRATKSEEGKKKVAAQLGKTPLKTKFEKKRVALQNRLNKLLDIVNKKRAKRDKLPATLVKQTEHFSKHKDKEVRAAFVAGGLASITQVLGADTGKKNPKAKESAHAKPGKGKRKA